VRAQSGGVEGNERLTAVTAVVLVVLLAALGVMILSIRPLIWRYVLLGMLLIPPVLLKLGSTGWRFVRYYRGAPGLAPQCAARCRGDDGGIRDRSRPARRRPRRWDPRRAPQGFVRRLVRRHGRACPRAPARASPLRHARAPGARLRQLLLAGTIVAGTVLALATVRYAHPWQHWLAVRH
jgi:hypothetical protein